MFWNLEARQNTYRSYVVRANIALTLEAATLDFNLQQNGGRGARSCIFPKPSALLIISSGLQR
jgi:hypothetical protein